MAHIAVITMSLLLLLLPFAGGRPPFEAPPGDWFGGKVRPRSVCAGVSQKLALFEGVVSVWQYGNTPPVH